MYFPEDFKVEPYTCILPISFPHFRYMKIVMIFPSPEYSTVYHLHTEVYYFGLIFLYREATWKTKTTSDGIDELLGNSA